MRRCWRGQWQSDGPQLRPCGPPQSASVEEVSRLARSAPGVFPPPETDKLQLWTDMSNPDDDTDVPSGLNDDARMERTSHAASSQTSTPASAGTSGEAMGVET